MPIQCHRGAQKGCVYDDVVADNFPLSVYMQSSTTGSANDLDVSTVVLAITETKLYWRKDFLAAVNRCHYLVCLSSPWFHNIVL